MNDDEDSSFDTSGSYVSSESKKTPRSSKRKRKYEILVTPYLSRRRASASSSKKKKNKHGLDIFFPNYLFSFVRKDSFEKALTVIENEEYLTLEEINKSDKFNLNFELLNVELYPNRDLAILRVRDGTICPSSVLCFPNSENWESLERSIIVDPVCRSNSPIIDLLLYNSSFSPLTFKEFILYRMKNVMAVKAKIDNKSLILCANGKDAYTTRIMTNQVSKQNIISKTNEKRYQELEEKYLQFISPKILKDQRFNSHTVSPKKHNNIKEDEVTKKISVIKGKIRKSFIEDSEEEGEVEDRIKNKRTKLKRVTYKTISELNSEHDCVNTFGIIVNILKENNNICKWRIAVEIIDQTQEKPPLKIYLFLPQRALVSLNNVIKVHQVVELVGLKVGKFNRAITGRVFAANQIELYDSITGGNIEWRVSSPKLNESESTLEIITNLRRWFKDKHIQSEENVNKDQKQKLSSNTSQVAELDLGDIEHIPKRVLSPRKKNLNQEKDKPLQSKTKQKSIDTISSSVLNEKKSCLYNMLDEIVPRENIDEVKLLKISYLKFYELEDLTEDDKFNMVIEVVNIHRYDEVNLEVIQVRDGTRCTLPMLHIPIEKSWSIAKKKILCNPSYTSDSPVVDILCFESQPYLLTLQVGKCYRIYNCLVIKTQLSDSSNGMDRCVICVEGKDCEVKNTSKIKIPETCLRNKGEKKAAESSGLPSSVFRQSKDYPESLRPFKRDQSEKEKATTILIGKKQTAVQDLDSRTPSLIGKKQTAVQDLDSITPSLIGKKQTAVQDLDSRTPSLIDLDETDGIHADIPFGMAKEIDSMMREESALGLPVTLSEDIHLKNSGSDPTYSQFAIHANQRSKLFKTSTQTFQREPMVRTLSTINSNSAQHLESIDLLNVNPTVLNDNIVYSPDSMESLRLELDDDEISNKGRTDNNDNIDNDELSNAGSESILSHRYRDRCLIDLDLTDQNVMVINEKKNVNKEKILLEKKINTSSSSDLDIVELDENITPKKDNGSLSNSKNSSANKGSPNKFLNNPLKEQPKLLIHAMLEKNFKLPSRCFYKSGNREEDSSDNSSESEDDDEGPEDSSSFPLDSHNYITTVTDYPDIPVMSIRTFLEIRNTNSHCYTTIPLKLSPELEDGWEEKAVHCICFKCNKTYVLSDVNKIVSEESDNWPNQKVPVCPLDGCPLKSATASFHFEFEIKLVKFNLTCTALLVSKSAETFLDCSVMEFLNCAKKRKEVKSRLKHLFHQNKTENANIYIFNLTRKNMFDVSPSPFYIKDIQLK